MVPYCGNHERNISNTDHVCELTQLIALRVVPVVLGRLRTDAPVSPPGVCYPIDISMTL
jgi:hypothetical protein